MSKDHVRTVPVRKVEKVAPDERGQSVWRGNVEPAEIELVSTTALEKILKSGASEKHAEIRKLAAGRKLGVLARDTATGHFRILSAADRGKSVPAGPAEKRKRDSEVTAGPLSEKTWRAADELSLVCTQYLRKTLNPGSAPEPSKPRAGQRDRFGGYNPYGDD